MIFADRHDAGRRLAEQLARFRGEHPVVLALPRGGVPIGFEIARALGAPLDIVLVRKIGAPDHPEFAIGAIVGDGVIDRIINEDTVNFLNIPSTYIEQEVARQAAEIDRRRKLYCGGRKRTEVQGHTALVVDDGIATGATMRVALQAIRRQQPKRLVLAVPVASRESLALLQPEADEIVTLLVPDDFQAVGLYYRNFDQTTDEEVIDLLNRAPPPMDRYGRAVN